MKLSLATIAMACTGAAAFAPPMEQSRKTTNLNSADPFATPEDLPGVLTPVDFFDPAGFADKADLFMDFQLREAKPSDLISILLVFEETICESCDQDYTPKQIEVWSASVKNRKRWMEAIANQYFMVAEHNKRIYGFASLEGNYLDFMYVHPMAQGRGLAKKLYRAIHEKALKEGLTSLTSDVSITAKPFFEHMGFESIKENRVERNGVELINFYMVRNKLA